MIKTIFFDIGGVLIDIHPERTYQYISDSVDIDISTIENRFPWGSHDKYERGTLSDEEWFYAYREALPQPCCLKSSDFWKAWKILLGEEKKTVQILELLKRNYSIWLLSNTNPKHIQEMIDYDGPVIFDCHVDPNENCFPMIPSGKPHNQMILGPNDQEENKIKGKGKALV